jgi:dephospho-CoA kinase
MSRWPGKLVIGLTGNLGTGKSAVRRMLEELGALGIDADVLAHQAMARGTTGYALVIEAFGEPLVAKSGEIDRRRLGQRVFSDPEALRRLEAILHPLVRQEVDRLMWGGPLRVVVLEAIKLLESSLARDCDSVWVVDAPLEVQLKRLVDARGMSEEEARSRLKNQSPQNVKRNRADVVIDNSGTLEETRAQVQAAWERIPRPPSKPPQEEPPKASR